MIKPLLTISGLFILALLLLGCGLAEPATNSTIPAEPFAETVTAAAVQEVEPTTAEKVTESTTETQPIVVAEPATSTELPAAEIADEPGAVLPEVTIPEETGETYVVNLVDGGFEVPEIMIKAGDTIVWQNVREKQPNKALIVAAAPCAQLKSPIFFPGSSFKWKFEKPVRCMIIDGIFTTQAMKVVVG